MAKHIVNEFVVITTINNASQLCRQEHINRIVELKDGNFKVYMLNLDRYDADYSYTISRDEFNRLSKELIRSNKGDE